MIEIYIPGNPIAKARPRFARRGKFVATYNPQETEEGFWVLQAIEQLKSYGLDGPLTGPISITCLFAIKRPKSHYGKNGLKPSAPKLHIQKPDVDNLLKFCADALNRCGIWHDDAQVASVTAAKVWSEDGIGKTSIMISTTE